MAPRATRKTAPSPPIARIRARSHGTYSPHQDQELRKTVIDVNRGPELRPNPLSRWTACCTAVAWGPGSQLAGSLE